MASARAQFYWNSTLPFYGFNRPGATVSEGIRKHWWSQGMAGSSQAHDEGVKAFFETDFTGHLEKIDVPTLILHGDDDRIVPLADSGPRSAKIVTNATLKVHSGYPHGMRTTDSDPINADLLAFIQG